jgi:hypothetical protein
MRVSFVRVITKSIGVLVAQPKKDSMSIGVCPFKLGKWSLLPARWLAFWADGASGSEFPVFDPPT